MHHEESEAEYAGFDQIEVPEEEPQQRGRCLGCRTPGPGYCGGCGSYIDDEWDGEVASHDPEINKRWEDGKVELMEEMKPLSDPRGDKRIAELETQVKRLQAENHMLWAHDHANGHTMRKDNEDIQANKDCFICQLYGKVEK